MGKYVGAMPTKAAQLIGQMVKGEDGLAYLVDRKGSAWQLVNASEPVSGGALGGGRTEETNWEKLLENLIWVTIEDPNTAKVKLDDGSNKSDYLKSVEWDLPVPIKKVRHQFGYALSELNPRYKDYCARCEDLEDLSGKKFVSVRDLINLIHCMTLFYKGQHEVYLQTAMECPDKVRPAHIHGMLAFKGIEMEGDTAKVVCSSTKQQPIERTW